MASCWFCRFWPMGGYWPGQYNQISSDRYFELFSPVHLDRQVVLRAISGNDALIIWLLRKFWPLKAGQHTQNIHTWISNKSNQHFYQTSMTQFWFHSCNKKLIFYTFEEEKKLVSTRFLAVPMIFLPRGMTIMSCIPWRHTTRWIQIFSWTEQNHVNRQLLVRRFLIHPRNSLQPKTFFL